MVDLGLLQAENEQLRLQIEEFRQREIADLRQQLAEAKAMLTYYRSEAERNANLGRQIAAEGQQAIADLRARLDVAERTSNARMQR